MPLILERVRGTLVFFSVPTAKTTPSVASEKDDVCIFFFFFGVQNVAGGKVSFQWHGRVVDDS